MIPIAHRSAGLCRWACILSAALFALASGCSPDIGDKCTVSTDCSVTGDRLCDSTQPAGYCTVFNCEPNGCPDNSICVSFRDPTCSSPAQSVRFERTFCMATCESNDDCRAQYLCTDLTGDPSRRVIDINPSTRSICAAVPPATTTSATLPTRDAEPAVCSAFDGGFTEASSPPSGAGADADATPSDATDAASDGTVEAVSE